MKISRIFSLSTFKIQPKETRALREFKKDYPDAQCFIFYGGAAPLYLDDITALPLERALKTLDQLLGP